MSDKDLKEAQSAKLSTNPNQGLAEFDWSGIGKKEDIYSKDQIVKLEAEYGESVSSINQHEILEGEIVSKTKREVVVNIGYKSEGIISTSEFRYNPELKIGDRVDVMLKMQRTELDS